MSPVGQLLQQELFKSHVNIFFGNILQIQEKYNS